MSAIPNLTQFFGPGPQPPDLLPDGSIDPTPTVDDDGFPLDFSIPSPWSNPDLWDSVLFTDSTNPDSQFMLPPVGMGTVKIKTPWKIKIDNKAGAGKKKPKSTQTGGETTKDKVTIEAVDEAWPYLLAAASAIVPGSGPWNVSHPKFTMAQTFQVEIEAWTDAPDSDGYGKVKWEIGYSQVDKTAQTGNGGGSATSTPDAADNQRTTPGQDLSSGPAPGKVDPNTLFFGQQSNAGKA